MKKYILFPLLVGLIPNVVFGASARYTQLVREKQRKMEQLEKCMGATKGLKIAGVSTLGLTAVGVAGNIYEAKVKNDTDKAIEKVDKKIEKTQQEIADKQAQKAEAEKKEKEKQKKLAEQEIQEQSVTEPCDETTHVKRGNMCIETELDCTESAKGNDANVVAASMNDGKCEIQQCVNGFIPAEDKESCVAQTQQENASEIQNDNKPQLTEEQKRDCLSKIMKDFSIGNAIPIPERYMSEYNRYLNELQNRIADKDGFIQYEVNSVSSICKKGQKWSQCTSSNIVLPAMARLHTKEYAENQECGESNDLSWNIGIKEQRVSFSGAGSENTDDINARKKQKCIEKGAIDYDPVKNRCVCDDNTVWSPSMGSCQSPETAAANAEFDRKFEDCRRHGAAGYSKDRGCLCENENTHEYDGTKCVLIDIDARSKCRQTAGNWENAKCNCPGGVNDYDPTTKTCKGYEKIQNSFVGFNVAPIQTQQDMQIKVSQVHDSNLQAKAGCYQSGGKWNIDNDTCDCPVNASYWNSIDYKCEMPVAEPSKPSYMMQMLAEPEFVEEPVVELPDRSATSYFKLAR